MLEDLNRGQGDLTRRIKVDSKDETAVMAGLNNELTGRPAEIVVQIKDVAETMRSGGE